MPIITEARNTAKHTLLLINLLLLMLKSKRMDSTILIVTHNMLFSKELDAIQLKLTSKSINKI